MFSVEKIFLDNNKVDVAFDIDIEKRQKRKMRYFLYIEFYDDERVAKGCIDSSRRKYFATSECGLVKNPGSDDFRRIKIASFKERLIVER